MDIRGAGPRITRTDVRDLNDASEALAKAADTINAMRPQWGPAVIGLLIVANNTIVRMQQRGAGAYARYLERNGVKELPGEAAEENTHQPSGAVENAQPEEA